MQQNKLKKADYGQDVPGLVRELLLMGGGLAILGVVIKKWATSRQVSTSPFISLLGLASLVTGTLSALEGLSYIFGSMWARSTAGWGGQTSAPGEGRRH